MSIIQDSSSTSMSYSSPGLSRLLDFIFSNEFCRGLSQDIGDKWDY